MQNNQQRQWASVSGGSDNQKWNPKATEKNGFQYNPQGNNAIEGYYSKFSEINGQSGLFCVHEVTLVNADGSLGDAIDVTGDKVLNDKMSKIEVGTFVRVEYKGRSMKKGYPAQAWSQTNSYHNWEVLEDRGAVKLHQLTGINPQGNPAVQSSNAPMNNNFNQGQPQFQNQGGQAFQNQGQPQFNNNNQGFTQQNNQQAPPQNNGGGTWTPPAGNQQTPFQGNPQQGMNQNHPPVNGNFGGQQQGINPMQGQGNPFAADQSDLPF